MTGSKFSSAVLYSLVATLLISIPIGAAEKPYFVTYDHRLEEPGNLEIAIQPVVAISSNVPRFAALTAEFEYGLKGWWTTEFYLDGQKTSGDSALFTGYRWENRFRPLMREHWLNPLLYVEFEHLNGADKTLREIVGFDSKWDAFEQNSVLREEGEREIETRLILSSDFRGWNVSENILAVKNLANEPWEFGYAFGANRPLALAASSRDCRLCAENFRAGIEFYGGLGTWHRFGLSGTSQYVAPVLSWELPDGWTLKVSPSFGLTPDSHRFLLRFGASYEIAGLGSRIGRMLQK